ncbi:MAG: pseudouridine synthase [Patescibacteria group bacterium]
MRLNRYLAYRYGVSRRKADDAISGGDVYVNGDPAQLGQQIDVNIDRIDWPGMQKISIKPTIILLHKPVGYVSSRSGQGSQSLYELLPEKYHHLKIAGRLDKDSSGLILLTNDGQLLHEMTHPSNQKNKRYIVSLDKPLEKEHMNEIIFGVDISDERPSRFHISDYQDARSYVVDISEGRNRQIRRTFEALGYLVESLHRIMIDEHTIDGLETGQHKQL